jgi:hypothetical protein
MHTHFPAKAKRVRRNAKRGSAVVELAVCMPTIVLLVLGAIEASTAIFVKQSLHVTAYEALRLATKPNVTNDAIVDHAAAFLEQRHVSNAVVEFIPADVEDVPRGEDITVRISAPVKSNSLTRLGIFQGDLTAEATMVKE